MKIGVSRAGSDGVVLDDQALRVELARRAWPLWRLAANADLAPTNLSAYRCGHKPVTKAVIARLEKALDLPSGALMKTAQPAQSPEMQR